MLPCAGSELRIRAGFVPAHLFRSRKKDAPTDFVSTPPSEGVRMPRFFRALCFFSAAGLLFTSATPPIAHAASDGPITRPIELTAFPSPGAPFAEPGTEGVPEPTRLAGWPQPLDEPYGSPVLCDLDADGVLEVVVGDRVRAYAFDHSGALRPGWPRTVGTVDHHPAIANLDDDFLPEIVFTIRQPRIACLDTDGAYLPGWPVGLPGPRWLNVSGPVAADLDGDGRADIGAQSELGIYFFDRFGHPLPGWPYTWSTTQNIAWSAPAVADLDGDGSNEVIVGTNRIEGSGVHVIRADGTPSPGWPFETAAIYSSPAVGDLDGDGDLEIVVQEGETFFFGRRLLVFHHDGTFVDGWPIEICEDGEGSRSNPAIADLDGDGVPEIVTATHGEMLHIYRADGTAFPGYPWHTPGYGHISSVQVADVDADGIDEIFLCYWDAGNQVVSGWRLDHTVVPGFPKLLLAGSELATHGSAHIADADGDGDLDLTASGMSFGTGSVSLFEIEGSVHAPGAAELSWPKIRRDLPATGRYWGLDPVGVGAESAAAFTFSVRPNPVSPSGSLWTPAVRGRGMLTAFDTAGRRVGRVVGLHGSGENVPVGELFGDPSPSGLYFVRLLVEGQPPVVTRIVVLSR